MPAFIAPANCRYDYEYDWICIWDCIKNLCHLKWPEIMLSIFKHAHRFIRWWALCTKHVNFPAFCGCESILGRKSTHIILSFHVPFMFLSFCIHFLSCSFHVPFLLHSFPFMFRRYVSMYQTYRSLKGGMLKPVRWVSAQTLAFFSYYHFAIVLEACAGCHLQGSWTVPYNVMYYYTVACTLWLFNIAMEHPL